MLACQPQEDIIAAEPVGLRFDKDTVSFDTIFTTEQSITRRLRVYNPSSSTVLIENIGLALAGASPYTLYVNGRPGSQFAEQALLPGDSLLVLLEARLAKTSDTLPYLAKDVLVFANKGLRQEVPIVSYGQNAQFIGDSVLACNTVWNSPLPYVIEKSILVDSLCTLHISKGSRLFFKPGAYLYVKGRLLAEGDTAQAARVLLRNHRQGPNYDHQLGQWGGLIFLPGSTGNHLRYTTIRNAEYGIYLGTPDEDDEPDLTLEYCKIENSLIAGIISYSSDLTAHHTLVNTAAQYTVANLAGGNYNYEHCTFVNFFSQRQELPALLLSDHVALADGSEVSEPLRLRLQNTIVWGNLNSSPEILVATNKEGSVMLEASHNLLRSSDKSWEGNGNILAGELNFPRFRDRFSYDYRLDTLSPAIDKGLPLGYQFDLSGRGRDDLPDIGAYEFIPAPDE
jgi:hypothetical protein